MEFKLDDAQLNNLVHVYVAQFPFSVDGQDIVPAARAEEIASCASPKVREEKFYAWKLLEKALWRSLGLRLEKLDLSKTDSGKWECSECCFSLSHSGNIVAVAVANEPVGVDVERKAEGRFTPQFAHKMLTCSEFHTVERLDEAVRSTALNVLWTKKEALFKLNGGGAFQPDKVETSNGKFVTKGIECADGQFFITVASESADRAQFFAEGGLKLVEAE